MSRTAGSSRTPAGPEVPLPGIGNDLTRRELLAGAGGLLLLGAAGCGGGAGGEGTAGGTRAIEHKYGTTKISGSLERVVSVGYTDQDPILALGVRPVGVRGWFGDRPHGVWPWAQDELGDAEPRLLPADAINYEQVAALEPDLIVGVSSGMTRDDYDTLSEFAPTLPQSDAWVDFGVPWQDQTRVIGRALGREDRAEKLVSDLEREFARVREEHPAFDGASVAVIGAGEGLFYLYTPEDRSVKFFTDLGFEVPEKVKDLSDGAFSVEISEEQFGLADTDVLVCFSSSPADEEAIRANELFGRLEAVREERVVYLSDNDDPLKGALSFNTVLSHPYLLENFVPRLAGIVGEDGQAARATRSS